MHGLYLKRLWLTNILALVQRMEERKEIYFSSYTQQKPTASQDRTMQRVLYIEKFTFYYKQIANH